VLIEEVKEISNDFNVGEQYKLREEENLSQKNNSGKFSQSFRSQEIKTERKKKKAKTKESHTKKRIIESNQRSPWTLIN
jgi:hypothetical protein